MAKVLKAPFVYFGGKSKVVAEVWRRFGAVQNYIEPFCGSAAVLLANPNPQITETINDMDGYLCNFWRAVKADPAGVAHAADWPTIELDLHARNDYMASHVDGFAEKLRADPFFFDVKMAGWWVWGKSLGIANSWGTGGNRSIPNLSGGNGINGCVAQPTVEWFKDLCARLRKTRVCCGDWSRILTPIVTTQTFGMTAVFLDPPYGTTEETKRDTVYQNDSFTVADDVRKWCIENGNNPLFRIALCGYDEHNEMANHGWSQFNWKATGGYGNQNKKKENTNARKECIWFSPHCINKDLFHGLED